MFRKMGIRAKIIFVLLMVSLLSLIINTSVALISIFSIRELAQEANARLGEEVAGSGMMALEQQAVADLVLIVDEKAKTVSAKLDKLESDVLLTARYLSDVYENPGEYLPIVPSETTDVRNKDILALQYTLAPGVAYESIADELSASGNVVHLFAPLVAENQNILAIYYGTQSGGLISYDAYSGYADTIYFEHRERPWFVQAKESGALTWSEVYKDGLDRGLVVTCAAPVYNPSGEFMGVFAMDVSLSDLDRDIVSSDIGQKGYLFLLDDNGSLISSPQYEDGSLLDDPNPDFVAAVEKMLNRQTGSHRLNYRGEDIYLAYAPLSKDIWSLGAVLPRDEVIAPAVQAGQRIDELSRNATLQMTGSIARSFQMFVIFFILVIIAVILTSVPFSNLLTTPIKTLVEAVKSIGGNNLTFDAHIHTGDEIETLATAFSQMTSELRQYIDNLAFVTAEKERIGTELSVATKIQVSMLPCIFPAFPDRTKFDVYATMLPAKEVGGDFYDFFLVDEDKLAVVIADVSGKGVPAALFMVIAKTLIKNNAQYGKSPKELFENVNNLLCESNDENMFVTAFMGIWDMSSGDFTYVNAGHNPPLIKRGGGDYEWLETCPGFVLAGMENMIYRQDKTSLHPGDVVYLYTDGVTEAVNRENELFSDDRLYETLNKLKELDIKELLTCVKREIDVFADGAEQADDITMLALKIKSDNTGA